MKKLLKLIDKAGFHSGEFQKFLIKKGWINGPLSTQTKDSLRGLIQIWPVLEKDYNNYSP